MISGKKKSRGIPGITKALICSVLLFWLNSSLVFPQSKWVGTWSTAPQLVEPHNLPPKPGLSNNSLRQIVKVSIGGDVLRVRFSNEFSTSPVTIKEANIALSTGEGKIDILTLTGIKFNKCSEVIMQPGTNITSDPVKFNLKPRTEVAITIYFGETSTDVTGHPGSRTTSYLLEFANAVTVDRWFVINGIDVKSSKKTGAIVILGNSITDGRGSGTNKQNRWPDILAERLLENESTKNVAVLNQGIGGNCVLKKCLGPAGIDRFERDILSAPGARWMIIFEAINDIGQSPDSISAIKVATDLINAYKGMIEKGRSRGLIVYGATILPFKESSYYSEFREAARQIVNNWIRNSNSFDAVIDFDLAMQSRDNPLKLIDNAHTGDYLHPNETGYRIMGDFIDLKLFETGKNSITK